MLFTHVCLSCVELGFREPDSLANNEIFYERFRINSDHKDLGVYSARKIFYI